MAKVVDFVRLDDDLGTTGDWAMKDDSAATGTGSGVWDWKNGSWSRSISIDSLY